MTVHGAKECLQLQIGVAQRERGKGHLGLQAVLERCNDDCNTCMRTLSEAEKQHGVRAWRKGQTKQRRLSPGQQPQGQ